MNQKNPVGSSHSEQVDFEEMQDLMIVKKGGNPQMLTVPKFLRTFFKTK